METYMEILKEKNEELRTIHPSNTSTATYSKEMK
jgi:hypothetical protein